MNAKFLIDFYEWITISTSSKSLTEDLNRVFSIGGMCHVHVTLPPDSYFGVDSLELRRLEPDSKEPCVLLEKEVKNRLTFQDFRRFTD